MIFKTRCTNLELSSKQQGLNCNLRCRKVVEDLIEIVKASSTGNQGQLSIEKPKRLT